ncbi:MAG: two-component regulator propeller domain-containing protein [Acidobacteriota bacterium]|nr:two-component regulator propeller domain-containing protein [Acidobacteriota bacterium]
MRQIPTILVCIAFCSAVQAQNFRSRGYTEADGLPSSTVYDICQTEDGSIWFATRAGVARYDGRNWEIHSLGNGFTLGMARKLAVDRQGNIWVLGGIVPNEVNRYDGKSWQSLPSIKKDDFPQQVSFALLYENGRTVPAVGVRGIGLFLFRDDRWHHYGEREGLQSDGVNGLASDGTRLFVAMNDGITVLTPDGIDNSYDHLLPEDRQTVFDLALDPAQDKNGSPRIWVLGSGRLGVIHNNTYRDLAEIPLVSLDPGGYGVLLYPDGDGGVFCGNTTAIYHYQSRTKSMTHFGIMQGLVDDGATACYRDRESNLWFAGMRGVTIIPSMRFANYDQRLGLLEDEVSAVLETAPGKLLLGHDSGFTFLDGEEKQRIPLNEPGELRDTGMRVMDLKPGRNGEAWAALSRNGVARISPDLDMRIIPSTTEREACYSVVMDSRDGTVWVGGENGLSVISGDKMVRRAPGNLEQAPVRRIVQGPSRTLFVATSGRGIRSFDEKWREFVFADTRTNEVYTVLEDSRYRIWVGTLAGLFRLEDGRLNPFQDQKENLIDRPVYSLTEDLLGRIWVGTDRGVYQLDGKRVRHYTVREGLAGDEINRASVIVDNRGSLWIGTNAGLSHYQEHYDHALSSAPLVTITNIESGGRNLLLDDPDKTGLSGRDLTFYFKAVSFIDEEQVSFSCRLRGYDSDWLAPFSPGSNYLRYTNLPAGQYTFEIKARNALGVWSEPVQSAPIKVRSLFWNSLPGFVVLGFAGLFFGVLAWVLHQRTERRIRQRTRWLEEKNQELERFDAIVRSINNELELDSLLYTLLKQAIGLYPETEKGFIMIWDPRHQAFRFGALYGYVEQQLEGYYLDYGMMTQGMDERPSLAPGIYLHNCGDETFFPRPVEAIPTPKARLALTLTLDDKIRGFLVFDNLKDRNAYREVDIRRLGRLRTHAISALAKARFLETLREKNSEILNAQRQLVLREKMASLGTLTAGVAHEIRNPLNFINNFSALNLQIVEELRVRIHAQATRPDGEVQWQSIQEELEELEDGARIINEHGLRAGKIIERMIQFSSFSKRTGERHPLDLSQILADQAASVMMTMSKKHTLKQLKVRKTGDEVLPPMAGNPEELSFLFGQLLTNAYEALVDREKHEPEHISILSYAAELRGDHFEVTISDNGLGIAEAYRSKIFAPFFTTREADSGNIGLGLFMSYEIAVNGYGGDIRMDRKDGMTQFTISLPLVAESSPVFTALKTPVQTAVRS